MFNQKQPLPFKIQVDKVLSLNNQLDGGTDKLKLDAKDLEFPHLRNVLWNRKPTGPNISIEFNNSNRKLQLVVSHKALELAFSQLQVHDEAVYQGFFAGYLNFIDEDTGESIQVILDRFDPGRYSQSKMLSDNMKIPTTSIPGDFCLPVSVQHGIAYADHKSTETFTSVDFTKAFYVLNSCLSRKEKLDMNQFLNMKMKCSFVNSGDKVLAYVSAGAVFISSSIEMIPVNSVPIIQTALARNLEENLNLSDMQTNVRTGYLTMDQTRKLLLLLDSDPKVSTLPLVGLWISGVDTVKSCQVWSSCMRFLFTESISERVHASPQNFLLLIFSPINANPIFYEFTLKSNNDELDFEFVSVCEGIQMEDSDQDDICFDLKPQSSGMLKSNFKAALSRYRGERETSIQQMNENEQSLDDSTPKFSADLSPHPQVTSIQTPSSLDISICESITLAEPIRKPVNEKQPKKTLQDKPLNLRNPRPTKASLIRINLNKATKSKSQEVGRKLANVSQKEKPIKDDKAMKEAALKEVNEYISDSKRKLEDELYERKDDHEDSIPRVPVVLRQEHLFPNTNTDKSFSVVLEPTYCPENYSDFEERLECDSVNESFNIPTTEEVQEELEEENEDVEENQEVDQEEETKGKTKENKNKEEIYKLLYEQQSQLAALQKQLQVFLKHQEKKEKKKEEQKEEQKKPPPSAGERQSDGTRDIQIAQQKQLQELQQQVQLFLQASSSAKSTPTSDSSVQCTPPSPPTPLRNNIGVNTGRSLLWPSENLAITQSDTALRGTQQAVPPSNSKPAENLKNRKWCRCCQHCERPKNLRKSPTRENNNNNNNNENESQSFSQESFDEVSALSEMKSQDIPSFNDTANSSQTITSSINAVDMPVFEETQHETPEKANPSKDSDWDKSPQLGESASVLMEKRKNVDQENQLEEAEVEENLLNNKEFYQQMMTQVQKLINAQSSVGKNSSGGEESTASGDEQFSNPPRLTSQEKLERVREATAKELQKLMKTTSTQNEEKRIKRQRSLSAATPPHPKINYVSMSVDDTFYDTSSSNINNIAAKYLPREMIQLEYRNNKTVKFEGVYELESTTRAGGVGNKNTTSVNFSCNMSIASKKYLQKYELMSGEETARQPLKDQNKNSVRDKKNNEEDEDCINGKENKILDLHKLRSLQKLK